LDDFKKSSPLKPLDQMNRNLVRSIYGRSSIKIANFVPGYNGKIYLSLNSLGKSYLSFNKREDYLEMNQSETRIACGGHVC
jgi:hypothetical protein